MSSLSLGQIWWEVEAVNSCNCCIAVVVADSDCDDDGWSKNDMAGLWQTENQKENDAVCHIETTTSPAMPQHEQRK